MQWPTACHAFWVRHETRESISVPHWGSCNPCEGRVLEWRLRMYGMYHHSTWVFARPLLSDKEFKGPTTDPREQHKVCQQQNQGRKRSNHQAKWHWQVHCKSFSFLPQKKGISVAQHGRISRGREHSHHVLQAMDLTHLRCNPNSKSNLTCPKLSPQ